MLWAIMDEAVLRRRIGDTRIMRTQLTHLIELAENPKVKVLIVPASADAHVGLTGRSSSRNSGIRQRWPTWIQPPRGRLPTTPTS